MPSKDKDKGAMYSQNFSHAGQGKTIRHPWRKGKLVGYFPTSVQFFELYQEIYPTRWPREHLLAMKSTT
jgi:hypothetical protein